MALVVAHLGLSGVGPALAQASGGGMMDFDLRVHEGPEGNLAYRLFVPGRWVSERRLLVMLHGCTQDAADLATGTAMNELGAEGGFAVLYPEQSPSAQPQRCWTWYDAAQQGPDGREVRQISALVTETAGRLGVGPEGTYLVGISAGGAMAGVLATARPELFAGLGIHSGIAVGAARNMVEGLAAMQGGGAPDRITADGPAFQAALRSESPRRVVILHGGDDPVVRPVNGEQVAAQWVGVVDARLRRWGATPLSAPVEESVTEEGRALSVRRWNDAEDNTWVYLGVVSGLGHAWSGGRPEGTYTDAAGPSASALFVRLLGLGGS